jgi:hypothetical protein
MPQNVLHIFERPDRKGTGEVRIHGFGVGIGKRGKAENILHAAGFLSGHHAIYLGPRGYCLVVDILHRGCVGLVSAHVILVGSSGVRQVFLMSAGVGPGIVDSSKLTASA